VRDKELCPAGCGRPGSPGASHASSRDIFAASANDTVVGRDGNDVIDAGPGSDNISGGGGDDRFVGVVGQCPRTIERSRDERSDQRRGIAAREAKWIRDSCFR
jgi:hypothetical protein